MPETVTIEKDEYEDMKDLMERMKETIDVLSNKENVKKLEAALARINSGEFLTEEQVYD